MPELSEVEAWRLLADRHARDQRILQVFAAQDDIVFDTASPRHFSRTLRGREIRAAHRRGKYLWLELDRRPWPLFHFGMTGSLRAYKHASERPGYCKAELTLDNGWRLGFRNVRRLGRVRLLQDPSSEPPVSRLGFDPLLDRPSPEEFRSLLVRRNTPIKALLLNQAVFAGVGNWIADEVLYQARIRPTRPASKVSPEACERLRRVLDRVVRRAVAVEADSTRFPRNWLFHVRWGKQHARTRKGEPIRYDTVGGRTTAWVPSVQR